MSLARNLSAYGDVAGNTARNVAPEIRAPRPTTRPVSHRARAIGGPIVLAGLLWAIFMSFSLVTVWRNTAVQQETSSITRGKDELARLNQQNRELEDRLVKATSATAVQDWALAQGMQRTSAFKNLTVDPTAVAVRPEPARAAQGTPAAAGFWGTVKGALSHVFGGSQSAAGQP